MTRLKILMFQLKTLVFARTRDATTVAIASREVAAEAFNVYCSNDFHSVGEVNKRAQTVLYFYKNYFI